jgi:putative oxidoreductase
MNTPSKLKTAGVWIVSGLLAALFLLTGIPKLMGAEGWLRHFARWGYPDWFRLVVGTVEVASAVLLLIPNFATLGACGVIVVMAGATYTHLFRAPDEGGRAVFTLAVLLLAAVVGFMRRSSRADEGTG